MNILLMTLLLFGTLVILLMLGLPVAFSIGGAALLFILVVLGPNSLAIISSASWEAWNNFALIAIPLFVLMAFLLEKSGLADDLYEAMYRWMGAVRGGLAIGTVMICTVFAAMAGNSAVGTITMGMVALPAMLKRGYDTKIALGSIAAGGTLGILIPPSVPMIIFGFLAEESIGKLFMAGIIPGLLMSLIFIGYVGIRCFIKPSMGPPVPKEDRYDWKQKAVTLKAVILPAILIIVVLGFMYMGVTTPTEGAGIGALGALFCTMIKKKLSWKLINSSIMGTLRMTAMAGWTMFGASLFTHVYASLGAAGFINAFVLQSGFSPWFYVIISQIILLFLGCFMDAIGIMIITVPIFIPIMRALGFDIVWFGILFTINMEIGYLTPPFGVNLFYLRILVPKHITMANIISSVWPFVGLQAACLILIMIYPQIALWLPNNMLGN